jgi:hypothetical protein
MDRCTTRLLLHAYSYTPTLARLLLHAYSYTPTLTRLLLQAYSYTPTLEGLLLHDYSYTPTLTRLRQLLHAYPYTPILTLQRERRDPMDRCNDLYLETSLLQGTFYIYVCIYTHTMYIYRPKSRDLSSPRYTLYIYAKKTKTTSTSIPLSSKVHF